MMKQWIAVSLAAFMLQHATAMPAATHISMTTAVQGKQRTTSMPVPTLIPRIPSASGSATSYPVTVSECYNFADPDEGAASGCQCENWEGVLPYLSGSSSCGYSTLASYIPPPTTTNTFDTMASFPYSMTLPNGAIIAYSSTTSIADAGPRQPWGGTGPSTTVQIGSVLTVQYDTDTSAQSVGTMTGDRLYTAISDALMTACPSPTSGSTVEACATPSPIKDIPYVSGSDLNTDGVLKFDIPFVGYSEPDIRIALIESIATAMNVSSLYPKNTETVSYGQPCYECVNTSPPTYKATLTRIPGAVQALFKVQDERTGGAVELNELQLQASFHLDTFDELFCSTAAFTADAIGALALIPPLDFLAVAAAPAALAFSLDCFLDEVETQPDD